MTAVSIYCAEAGAKNEACVCIDMTDIQECWNVSFYYKYRNETNFRVILSTLQYPDNVSINVVE